MGNLDVLILVILHHTFLLVYYGFSTKYESLFGLFIFTIRIWRGLQRACGYNILVYWDTIFTHEPVLMYIFSLTYKENLIMSFLRWFLKVHVILYKLRLLLNSLVNSLVYSLSISHFYSSKFAKIFAIFKNTKYTYNKSNAQKKIS